MRLIEDRVWGILTVWQEARGESFLGKVAVAEVILRRTKNKYMSDGTVAGTVLRKYQFSGWNTGDTNRILAAKLDDQDGSVQDCIKAWDQAEKGTNYVPECMHYYNPNIVEPYWAMGSTQVALIGNHNFVIPQGVNL